jgi:hypothetical protein
MNRQRVGIVLAGKIPRVPLEILIAWLRSSTCREAEVVTIHAEPPGSLPSGGRWAPLEPGEAPALNVALRVCHAKYVAFLSSSEALASPFLGQACYLLDKEPGVDFVSGWRRGPFDRADDEALPCEPWHLLARPWLAQVPTLFRRTLWEELGGFDEALGLAQPLDLWLRALGAGKRGLALDAGLGSAIPFGREALPARDEAQACLGALFAKHRALVEANLERVVVERERVVRALARAQGGGPR